MTLTTEQLRARIGHLKERLRDMKQHKYPDNCPNATAYLESLKAERQQDIALLEELLANREAQPSITDEAIHRIVVPLSPDGLDEEKHHCEWHLYHDRERIRKELREYFAAPPAPAVPPEKKLPELMMASYHEAIGWNACRAAMLAQPVSSGYKLAPIEPTEDMIAAAMNCDDVSFNADETFCVNFGNIYAAMLAAAPESGNDHDTRR
ncbi:hypothetical protein SJZ82_06875 [Serratia marcescens]|uniref:hypothetical protein n=1 Tax=Serratia marcescens TaxID=615 RepID=UPI0029D6EC72|nr:hypothetical protein [Serratia marcescens]MDX6800902.1 hypothetical protein [Serratia marcescens]